MDGDGGHTVHSRLGDILDHDGDIEVPSTDSFVVRGGHESAVLINKSDRISVVVMTTRVIKI
jgi:hypothetical protein